MGRAAAAEAGLLKWKKHGEKVIESGAILSIWRPLATRV